MPFPCDTFIQVRVPAHDLGGRVQPLRPRNWHEEEPHVAKQQDWEMDSNSQSARKVQETLVIENSHPVLFSTHQIRKKNISLTPLGSCVRPSWPQYHF